MRAGWIRLCLNFTFQFLFVDDFSAYNLDANVYQGPSKHFTLTPNGVISSHMEGKLTVSCVMDFSCYPFDTQVRQIKISTTQVRSDFYYRMFYQIFPELLHPGTAEEGKG